MCRLYNSYNAGPVPLHYVLLILVADEERSTFIRIEYILPIEKNEMGGVCGAYGGGENGAQGFGGEA